MGSRLLVIASSISCIATKAQKRWARDFKAWLK